MWNYVSEKKTFGSWTLKRKFLIIHNAIRDSAVDYSQYEFAEQSYLLHPTFSHKLLFSSRGRAPSSFGLWSRSQNRFRNFYSASVPRKQKSGYIFLRPSSFLNTLAENCLWRTTSNIFELHTCGDNLNPSSTCREFPK